MTEEYNPELCEERHKKIDTEFQIMRQRMNGFEKKLWGILILLAMNLTAISVVGFFVKNLSR